MKTRTRKIETDKKENQIEKVLRKLKEILMSDPTVAPPPAGWSMKESSRHPGTFYYIHQATGQTQWERPAANAPPIQTQEQTLRIFSLQKKTNSYLIA